MAVVTNASIAISLRLKIKQVKLKSSTSQAGSAAESNKALGQPRSLGPTTKISNPRLVGVPWMAEILHQLIGKFTVSHYSQRFNGFDTSLYNFSPQTLCSMHIDGTGRAVAVMIGDVDPI